MKVTTYQIRPVGPSNVLRLKKIDVKYHPIIHKKMLQTSKYILFKELYLYYKFISQNPRNYWFCSCQWKCLLRRKWYIKTLSTWGYVNKCYFCGKSNHTCWVEILICYQAYIEAKGNTSPESQRMFGNIVIWHYVIMVVEANSFGGT